MNWKEELDQLGNDIDCLKNELKKIDETIADMEKAKKEKQIVLKKKEEELRPYVLDESDTYFWMDFNHCSFYLDKMKCNYFIIDACEIKIKITAPTRGSSKYRDDILILYDQAKIEIEEIKSNRCDYIQKYGLAEFVNEFDDGYNSKLFTLLRGDPSAISELIPSDDDIENAFLHSIWHNYEYQKALIKDCNLKDSDDWIYGDWDDDHVAQAYMTLDGAIAVPIDESHLDYDEKGEEMTMDAVKQAYYEFMSS